MKKAMDRIEEVICVICTVLMVALVFAQVVSRKFLHFSLSFSDEISTYLFVLLSMMGASIAARRRAHLGLSILTDAVPPMARKVLVVIGYGVATIFSAALTYYGALMVANQVRLAMVTPAMQWPEWIYAIFVPLGALFTTVRFAQVTWEEGKAPLTKHEEGDHKL